MRRELAVALVLLGTGAGISLSAPPRSDRVPLKVLGTGKDFQGQVWAHTLIPPMLSFRVKAGKVPEKGLGVVLCSVENTTQEVEATNHVNHRFNTITLHCEGGLVLELEGLDLAAGEQ